MEATIAAVLMVAMVAGVTAWMVHETRARKATNEALARPLAERGWTVVARDDHASAGLTAVPFGAGSQRRCEDVIRSADDGIVSFTYRWTTGSGQHRNRHTRRVTMLAGGLVLPRIEVEADTIVAKMRAAAAGGDHDVELAEFNRAWSVRAADDRVAHAVLHPGMIQRFMSPDLIGRSVFFEQGRIGLVDYVIQLRDIVSHTEASIAILRDIDALIPTHVRTEFDSM